MAKTTKDEDRPVFIAPAGTIVFADTTGWHRGGFAVTSDRFVVQALFQSNRCTSRPSFGCARWPRPA